MKSPPNNELQRTRDGNAAASPLNSVLGGPESSHVTARTMAPHKRERGVFVTLCLSGWLSALGCGGGPTTTPHKLSSGRTIRVLSVGQMHFQQSGPGLVMSYETDLKVDDTEALAKEVADIWADFQNDATKANVGSAIIMANEIPSGTIIKQGKTHNFVFERNKDGTWPKEPLR